MHGLITVSDGVAFQNTGACLLFIEYNHSSSTGGFCWIGFDRVRSFRSTGAIDALSRCDRPVCCCYQSVDMLQSIAIGLYGAFDPLDATMRG